MAKSKSIKESNKKKNMNIISGAVIRAVLDSGFLSHRDIRLFDYRKLHWSWISGLLSTKRVDIWPLG